MKATEFCKFFDFSIKTIEDYGDIGNIEDEWFVYGENPKYVVTDDQGCFDNRYVEDVSLLSECFDSMLKDYIDDDIEENGFVYDLNKEGTYYEQALEWIRKSSDIYTKGWADGVIQGLIDPITIEDDVRESEVTLCQMFN